MAERGKDMVLTLMLLSVVFRLLGLGSSSSELLSKRGGGWSNVISFNTLRVLALRETYNLLQCNKP